MKIKELLATPDKWTQGANARNSRGDSIWVHADDAARFCLLGAATICYPNSQSIITERLFKEVGTVVFFNDAPERTHAEILALVTKLDI